MRNIQNRRTRKKGETKSVLSNRQKKADNMPSFSISNTIMNNSQNVNNIVPSQSSTLTASFFNPNCQVMNNGQTMLFTLPNGTLEFPAVNGTFQQQSNMNGTFLSTPPTITVQSMMNGRTFSPTRLNTNGNQIQIMENQ